MYWLKCVLHTGSFYITSKFFFREMWFIDFCDHEYNVPHSQIQLPVFMESGDCRKCHSFNLYEYALTFCYV